MWDGLEFIVGLYVLAILLVGAIFGVLVVFLFQWLF